MDIIKDFISKYGFFIVGGSIGAIIHRLRYKMTLSRFIKFLFIAIITALSAGIIAKEVFNLSETVCYVVCGIFGAFSEQILDEIEEFIKSLSDIAKKKLGYEETENNNHKKEIEEDKHYEESERGN